MQNLNQIRARHVMELVKAHPDGNFGGVNGGEVVKKIPPRIMNNGLLAALAYSLDEKNKGWKNIFDGIAQHLSSKEIMVVDRSVYDTRGLLYYLVEQNTSSIKLREATAETMAWLDFARRLIVNKNGEEDEE